MKKSVEPSTLGMYVPVVGSRQGHISRSVCNSV